MSLESKTVPAGAENDFTTLLGSGFSRFGSSAGTGVPMNIGFGNSGAMVISPPAAAGAEAGAAGAGVAAGAGIGAGVGAGVGAAATGAGAGVGAAAAGAAGAGAAGAVAAGGVVEAASFLSSSRGSQEVRAMRPANAEREAMWFFFIFSLRGLGFWGFVSGLDVEVFGLENVLGTRLDRVIALQHGHAGVIGLLHWAVQEIDVIAADGLNEVGDVRGVRRHVQLHGQLKGVESFGFTDIGDAIGIHPFLGPRPGLGLFPDLIKDGRCR